VFLNAFNFESFEWNTFINEWDRIPNDEDRVGAVGLFVFLGDSGVGKTSIARQYITGASRIRSSPRSHPLSWQKTSFSTAEASNCWAARTRSTSIILGRSPTPRRSGCNRRVVHYVGRLVSSPAPASPSSGCSKLPYPPAFRTRWIANRRFIWASISPIIRRWRRMGDTTTFITIQSQRSATRGTSENEPSTRSFNSSQIWINLWVIEWQISKPLNWENKSRREINQ
jgi:GTPase SAR1 family protein